MVVYHHHHHHHHHDHHHHHPHHHLHHHDQVGSLSLSTEETEELSGIIAKMGDIYGSSCVTLPEVFFDFFKKCYLCFWLGF